MSLAVEGLSTMDDQSVDLAIDLEELKIVDMYFHSNKPLSDNLRCRVGVGNPEGQFEINEELSRTRFRALVSAQCILDDSRSEGAITQEDIETAPMSFGVVVAVTVGAPAMEQAIPTGKHAARTEDDLETERNRRMQHNMRLEAIKAGYSFASSKLLEISSLSPFGPVPMPLMDAEALLNDIENRG